MAAAVNVSIDAALEQCPKCHGQGTIRIDPNQPTIELIQRMVTEHFHVKLAELLSRSRRQHLTFVRQLAMYLIRKLTAKSFMDIGDQFGRDHSTVIHAFNVIDQRVHRDDGFRRIMEAMQKVITDASSQHRGDSRKIVLIEKSK